jgi:hypothetical protein
MNNIINSALGISNDNSDNNSSNLPAVNTTNNTVLVKANEKPEIDLEKDFSYAKENVVYVIENGKDALEKLLIIADQSQQPRAFEVISKLMDSIINANRSIIDMHEQIMRSGLPVKEEVNNTCITNNLLVATTAELTRMIKKIKNNDYLDLVPEEEKEDEV